MEEMTFTINIIYNDGSEFFFDVHLQGTDTEVRANLMMITRGTLMASSAHQAVCYNSEGFDICSYYK